jgi:membrane associated rhomboid family serine protease
VSTVEIPRTLGIRLQAARWAPVWSVPAARRAVRAVVVVCGLFALTDQAMGNLQIATFAAFGGFATLVLAASVARGARSSQASSGRTPPRG